MLYITVWSRRPSARRRWLRSKPSRWAPSFSMARCARRLLAAVFSCTRTSCHSSKAWRSIRYLIMRLRPVPCWPTSSQVAPISAAGSTGLKSKKLVVPTSSPARRMANTTSRPSRCSARALRYQSGRVVPLMNCCDARLASASCSRPGRSASVSGSRRRAPCCRATGWGLNMTRTPVKRPRPATLAGRPRPLKPLATLVGLAQRPGHARLFPSLMVVPPIPASAEFACRCPAV